ncbi:MAG: aminotransferase class III-fold pyridoxal phosphate-dependent enzyme [Acidobacteriia bacterium]|nr:aminotransferase class III-fold pyridoxal phosphate-dependent enzyme [Terriglobia bacterium]
MGANDEISCAYAETCKPGLQKVLKLLRLDIPYLRAEGENLYYRDPAPGGGEIAVADFLGGYGSTILGHHPPAVRSAMVQSLEKGAPVHAQASVRGGAARLARELNRLAGHKYFVHLLNTGTEATEAAIKHALMEWRSRQEVILLGLARLIPRVDSRIRGHLETLAQAVRSTRPVIFALEGSFHGKTAGSLSVTDNPSYVSMYPERAVQCRFIPRSASADDVNRFFTEARIQLSPDRSYTTAIGVIAEVIQGEGGIHPIAPELLSVLRRKTAEEGIPLIVDEIQSGLWRTGAFLASRSRGITADYLLLGKSLGGGIAKISALLVSADRYQEDFGLKHTSTFAEDELSCAAALAALDELERRSEEIAQRARAFEARIRDCCERMMRECPGVIQEVRGEGFFMGIEFRADADSPDISHALTSLMATGYFVYVLASYLLHRRRLRVAAALSETNTLRLEPPAFISQEAVDRLVAGIEEVTRLIYSNRIAALTAHLWEDPEQRRDSPRISPLRPYPVVRAPSAPPRTVFLSHLIERRDLRDVDPIFDDFSENDLAHYLDDFAPLTRASLYYQQLIKGPGGREILFELRGFTMTSDHFERAIRMGNVEVGRMVCDAAQAADRSGATHIGLGQYTSIVTDNGQLIQTERAKVTTGNSLTIGFSFETIQRILEQRGMNLRDLHVGVVGVAGNICNVLAQLLGDEARTMTLVHRERIDESPKFRKAIATVIENSRMDSSRIRPTTDMALLADCDVVVLGTNSSHALLMPEHLKKDVIVLDVSVPSNVHESIYALRPDVECFQGGYARLPMGQKLVCPLIPVPHGEIFACMAETVMTGLLNYPGHFSRGYLSKKHVTEVLRLAAEAGIEYGAVERISPLRRAASPPIPPGSEPGSRVAAAGGAAC